ncbi:MAG: zinc ABC transporter substrate-binding protein [Anaerolineales bacterium]
MKVVASTQILGDVVAVIGGEHIELSVLIPPDSDPHAFEPTPQDAARLADADLVFVNGLGLEEALQPLLESEGLNSITVSEGIAPIAAEPEDHDETQEEHAHEAADPHVWMNPLNVQVWAANIATALAAADPPHATAYRANAAAYQAELAALDTWALEQIAKLPVADRILVTDHESFGYFADHYGFKLVGAIIPSLSTVSEPSAGEVAQLEDAIRQFGVKAIFVSAGMNPALAERVATDTGIFLVPLYVESPSADDGPAPTYLDLIRYDVLAIVNALQ